MTVEPPASSGSATGSPPAEPEPPARLRGGLLRHHDFRQLFIGDTLSQFGTQLTGLAIPVLAVKVLDAGAFEMGLLATCEFLAFLVIGLPAGAWVDRWRKQRVLVSNDLIRAVALASLPLALALDLLTFPQMLVVALVVGCCTVFFDVAYQSYLPDMVEPEHIEQYVLVKSKRWWKGKLRIAASGVGATAPRRVHPRADRRAARGRRPQVRREERRLT